MAAPGAEQNLLDRVTGVDKAALQSLDMLRVFEVLLGLPKLLPDCMLKKAPKMRRVLPGSPVCIGDVGAAEGAGLLQVDDNEVLLHALDGLPQLPHQLLVRGARCPVALALLARPGCPLGVAAGLLPLLASLASLLRDAVQQVLRLAGPVITCRKRRCLKGLFAGFKHGHQVVLLETAPNATG